MVNLRYRPRNDPAHTNNRSNRNSPIGRPSSPSSSSSSSSSSTSITTLATFASINTTPRLGLLRRQTPTSRIPSTRNAAPIPPRGPRVVRIPLPPILPLAGATARENLWRRMWNTFLGFLKWGVFWRGNFWGRWRVGDEVIREVREGERVRREQRGMLLANMWMVLTVAGSMRVVTGQEAERGVREVLGTWGEDIRG